MKLKTIRTRRFVPPKDDINELLKELPKINEGAIVAISSKVISICEGNTVSHDSIPHDELVRKLADAELEPVKRGKNGMILTQVGNILVESAGVDESNSNGFYILLPKNPYKTAEYIWEELKKRNGIHRLGIVITDSHSVPRRKGAVGYCLASYGFMPVNIYDNEKDIFGREFRFTGSDVSDSIAAIATLEMGEGSECTPVAIMEDFSHVSFITKHVSIKQQKAYSWVHPELDVYSPLLSADVWRA